jgi:hypothetical protein
MLIDGKQKRNLGEVPHSQLVEWARALDRVLQHETDLKHRAALQELQKHLWASIQRKVDA